METQQLTEIGKEDVIFLSWCCPWPGYSGSALRTQGLLREIAHEYSVKLIVFTDKRLSDEQKRECLKYAKDIIEVEMKRDTLLDKLRLILLICTRFYPYHPAIVVASIRGNPIETKLRESDAIVYCAGSQFYTAADRKKNNKNWIVDQFDAAVDYWRLRARELRNPAKMVAASINRMLTNRYCRDMYCNAGCIVSVCEEDRDLTKNLVHEANVEVVENGVDCSYFQPHPTNRADETKRILFTGTSNERNMKGLMYFLKDIYPKANEVMKDIELIIAGDFSIKAQKALSKHAKIVFTGRIEDIRPVYEMCDVFINPFYDAYGSKLKISQALSMGMCIVTTRSGARGFPLEDGVTALIANDKDEFLAKLLLALRNESLRSTIGANGRRLAEERLDWSVLGERLRSILRKVVY